MAITASKREGFSNDKHVGLAEFEVVEFNKPLDSDGKEIKYLGEKEGNVTFRVAVTLKEVKSGELYPLSFFLENKVVSNKAGTSEQYINSVGRTIYADKPENLSEKFAAFPYRKARVGEADLVSFLDAWLDIDRKASYDLTPNWDNLMKGNIKEFNDLLKPAKPEDKLTRTVTGMALVRVSEKDGEVKEYQQIYNRKLLPGYTMRHFRATSWTEDLLNNLRDQRATAKETKKWLKDYEQFAVDVTDSQYGIKDAYFLGPLKVYNAEENVPAGNEALVAEDDASY